MATFKSKIKFYLQQATVRSSGDYRSVVAATMVQTIGEGIRVESASVSIGSPFAGPGNVSQTPIFLEATYSGASFAPTDDAAARGLVRAFIQTHTLQSGSGFAYDGAAIIAALTPLNRTRNGVKVESISTVPVTVVEVVVEATPADVPVTTTVTEAATGDRVQTTTTPVVGTRTARRTTVRTSAATGQATTTNEVFPFVKAQSLVGNSTQIQPSSSQTPQILLVVGGVVLVAVAYWYSTKRKGSRRGR